MTRQEMFEKASRHLFQQGKRAVTGLNRCVYRGPNGLMCAVGCLIPDEMYNLTMEELGSIDILLSNRVVENLTLPKGINHVNESFLGALQNAHDVYEEEWTTEGLRERLKEVGRYHNCRIGFLDTLSIQRTNEQPSI